MKLRLSKPEREAIGARFREVRRFNRLEQTEIAERAGLSQAIISQYEKGLTEVSLSFIKFLVDTFDISGNWLIFGSAEVYSSKRGAEKVLFRVTIVLAVIFLGLGITRLILGF